MWLNLFDDYQPSSYSNYVISAVEPLSIYPFISHQNAYHTLILGIMTSDMIPNM